MTIYNFEYRDCIYEGSYYTVSSHKTFKRVYKSMRSKLLNDYISWYNLRTLYGKDNDKCSVYESWRISKRILED